jgi:hypothetical protein
VSVSFVFSLSAFPLFLTSRESESVQKKKEDPEEIKGKEAEWAVSLFGGPRIGGVPRT